MHRSASVCTFLRLCREGQRRNSSEKRCVVICFYCAFPARAILLIVYVRPRGVAYCCCVGFRIESFDVSKYRTSDISYRMCVALHIPVLFTQIRNESVHVSSIETISISFCLSVTYQTRFRCRYPIYITKN